MVTAITEDFSDLTGHRLSSVSFLKLFNILKDDDDNGWTNLEDAKKISNCETPKEAKKIGNEIEIVHNWDLIKIEKMREVIFEKFSQNEILKKELIKMKDEDLVEWNDWGDVFWGKDIKTGNGENNLGKILIEVRDNLM